MTSRGSGGKTAKEICTKELHVCGSDEHSVRWAEYTTEVVISVHKGLPYA
jgi:hypothetical protein